VERVYERLGIKPKARFAGFKEPRYYVEAAHDQQRRQRPEAGILQFSRHRYEVWRSE
jgi:hypothetical protein